MRFARDNLNILESPIFYYARLDLDRDVMCWFFLNRFHSLVVKLPIWKTNLSNWFIFVIGFWSVCKDQGGGRTQGKEKQNNASQGRFQKNDGRSKI